MRRDDPEAPEMLSLMRILRDMNLSKFVAEDAALFLSLIGDVFPSIRATATVYDAMEAPLSLSIEKLQLEPFPAWRHKIVQARVAE